MTQHRFLVSAVVSSFTAQLLESCGVEYPNRHADEMFVRHCRTRSYSYCSLSIIIWMCKYTLDSRSTIRSTKKNHLYSADLMHGDDLRSSGQIRLVLATPVIHRERTVD